MATRRFTAAFLNCYNLFPDSVRAVRRPTDTLPLAEKVRGLAAALMAGGRDPPALIGLSEVGDAALGREVLAAVSPGRYSALWQPPPAGGLRPASGLIMGYDTDEFSVEEDAPGEMTVEEDGRYHWLAARLRLRRTANAVGQLWVVVVHWPSDYGRGPTRSTWPRMQVSRALGEFWQNRASNAAPAMLIGGDFNCEPFDPPLTGEFAVGDRIMVVREHDRATRSNVRLPYFYTPTWRMLGQPVPLEHVATAAAPGRPPGTYADPAARGSPACAWRSFDHILVNRWLMAGEPASLLEATASVTETPAGASDHCAVAVSFEYVT